MSILSLKFYLSSAFSLIVAICAAVCAAVGIWKDRPALLTPFIVYQVYWRNFQFQSASCLTHILVLVFATWATIEPARWVRHEESHFLVNPAGYVMLGLLRLLGNRSHGLQRHPQRRYEDMEGASADDVLYFPTHCASRNS